MKKVREAKKFSKKWQQASRTADDDVKRQAKICAGSCMLADCTILAAAEQALARGQVFEKPRKHLQHLQCSSALCTMGGRIHAECYEKLEPVLQSLCLRTGRRANTRFQASQHDIWYGRRENPTRPPSQCAPCLH